MMVTPGLPPEGADSTPVIELGSPEVYWPLPLLMRTCDSRTATATGSATAPPVFTRATASEGWLMVVGCSAGLISDMGAMELPPETEDSVPARVSSRPCAPASAMPYIGLCGLVWVSFWDMAQNTAPLVPEAVAAVVALVLMPRMIAESPWNSRPRDASTLALELGTMLPGTPSLP